MVQNWKLGRRVALMLMVSLFMVIFALNGCTSCTTQSVPLHLSVEIKDPDLKSLVAVAERVDLTASGNLRRGTYHIGSKTLTVISKTQFSIDAAVPLRGSLSVIEMTEASGMFKTSAPVRLNGVPVPVVLPFSKGVASAELSQIIASFVVSVLQGSVGPDPAHDSISHMHEDIHIKKATLTLRPGSTLEWHGNRLTFGQGSVIELSEAQCDDRFNYRANGRIRLDLAACSMPINEHSSIRMRNAEMVAFMEVSSKDGVLEMHQSNSPWQVQQPISMMAEELGVEKSIPVAGASSLSAMKLSGKTSAVSFYKFGIRKIRDKTAELSGAGQIRMADCALSFNGADEKVLASMPQGMTADLDFATSGGATDLSLNIADALEAREIEWVMHRGKSRLVVKIDRARLNHIRVKKGEQSALEIAEGTVTPSNLEWSSGKQSVTVQLLPGAKLALSKGIKFAGAEVNSLVSSGVSFPVDVRLGSARIKTDAGKFECSGLKGRVNVDAGRHDIVLAGNLDLDVKGKADFLSSEPVNAHVGSLAVKASDEQISLSLKNCRLFLPLAPIKKSIKEGLPDKKTFNVNKVLFTNRKWRYRNFILKQVDVLEPQIQSIEFAQKNEIEFDGAAKIQATGTVERFSVERNLLAGKESAWEERPWQAEGSVTGKGRADYQLLPGKTLSESAIKYDAMFSMPVPKDLAVDWSTVSGGILGRSEQSLISEVILHADYFTPRDGITLKHSGRLPLFTKKDERLNALKVSKFSTLGNSNNLIVQFDAQAGFGTRR